MNLGEFRRLTAEMPDDTEILVDDGSLDSFFEVRYRATFFAVMDLPPVVWLEEVESRTLEYDMHHRVDAWLDIG